MTRFELAVLLALAAVPASARPRAPRPEADALLLRMLAGPATGYAAVERVQVFPPGKKPKALKADLTALPGGRVRREVRPARKNASPVVWVSDPERPDAALARLKDLYAFSVSTGGVVAKRRTWKVDLHLRKGAPVLRRSLWVDRDSGLLLKRETYRDDGSLRRRERLVKLELPAAVPASFAEAPPPGPWLPEGFALAGEAGGVQTYSNGLERFEVRRSGGKASVTGDLAEDDAARVLEGK